MPCVQMCHLSIHQTRVNPSLTFMSWALSRSPGLWFSGTFLSWFAWCFLSTGFRFFPFRCSSTAVTLCSHWISWSGKWHQSVMSLVLPTLIPWVKWDLPGFFIVKLLFFFTTNTRFCGKRLWASVNIYFPSKFHPLVLVSIFVSCLN